MKKEKEFDLKAKWLLFGIIYVSCIWILSFTYMQQMNSQKQEPYIEACMDLMNGAKKYGTWCFTNRCSVEQLTNFLNESMVIYEDFNSCIIYWRD